MSTLLVLSACRETPQPPPPLVPQISGTIEVTGLSAPVRIVRDRWGVPHIYAQSQDDLFVAQGLVQAQDRLFQMDLWRRSVQGRLADVLGPNFVERDAMTRRMQYRGDLDVEWASYGPDVKAIAAAFTRGINAWVSLARERPPEEFVLAGWKPDFWLPVDLLNRTDAFVGSGDALDEIRRANMSDVVADAVRRVGTPPFFMGLAAAPAVRSNSDDTGTVRRRGGARSAPGADQGRPLRPDTTGDPAVPPDQMMVRSTGGVTATRAGVLSLTEARRTLDHPSRRYFVHLNAPGWNVIGATAPWLPGVAAGHNERIAWGSTGIEADTQDIYVRNAGSPTTVIKERIVIKGRAEPFVFDCEITPHGVIIATDRERHQAYSVRWSGTEPGAAPELAALAMDRARTWQEFRAALARWKMPARRVVWVDVDRHVGFQDVALVPVRRSGEWVGWRTIDDLPHAFGPRGDSVTATDATRRARPDPVGRAEATFVHTLAITADTRSLFNVGPVGRPTDDSPVRATFDSADWDRSRAMNAPGQSASPASAHFSDLAKLWAAGELFPLLFTDAAVEANSEAVLTLIPKQ